MRPGMITAPSQKPEGGLFGTPGPDTGYAMRILRKVDGDIDDNVAAVLVSLMSARAAALGRAPIQEDLEVAKLLAGMHERLPSALADRMKRWTEAVSHERWSNRGRLAVAEVPSEQLVMKPDELRGYLTNHL